MWPSCESIRETAVLLLVLPFSFVFVLLPLFNAVAVAVVGVMVVVVVFDPLFWIREPTDGGFQSRNTYEYGFKSIDFYSEIKRLYL